ncbi:MAG: hypothetical protein K2O18_03850 [Oscillospiraceae bacterium]|nr:hypothetical protein [Oscillospiraceae bacterium]
METLHKRYPVIGTNPQEYIPWGVLIPHENQALRNHSQTLERLAERGGLSWNEILPILRDQTWRECPMIPDDEAKRLVLGYVAAWEAEQAKGDYSQ